MVSTRTTLLFVNGLAGLCLIVEKERREHIESMYAEIVKFRTNSEIWNQLEEQKS